MAAKLYCIYFSLYLFILSSSVFNFEGSLYNLKTPSNITKNKICLIIIDGLRYDYVHYMEFVSSLSNNKNAVYYKSICSIPTYSRPGYERILTGSDTFINGIKSNQNKILSLTPNIFYLCKISNLKTACCGYYYFKELYPIHIDYGYYYFYNDNMVFNRAEEFINKFNPDFIVIHPMIVDNAGHKFGAKSLEYINAVKKTDQNIKNIWHTLEVNNYISIITSDHGHKNKGGHGDGCKECINTPFIMINNTNNKLIKENKSINQIDIAPTICDLLGISKTIYMEGESLIKNNDINAIRKIFYNKGFENFKNFFYITSILTYIILSFYTIIYFSSFFLIIQLTVNRKPNK